MLNLVEASLLDSFGGYKELLTFPHMTVFRAADWVQEQDY